MAGLARVPNYGIGRTSGPDTPVDESGVRTCIARCHALLSDRGAVPEALAGDVLAAYRSLAATARTALIDQLALKFSAEPAALRRAAEEYLRHPFDTTLMELQRAAEAPRRELFLRVNAARGGTGFLVDLREHLLQGLGGHPTWAAVEADLSHVLKSVFNRGLLEFHQIDWETPAPVLEKLIQYEAVHEICDWSEMRRRLEADRRCYAFFHPAWPGEPLIFAELALTRGMSTKVQPLLDPESPVLDANSCDCAIFYSISSCQQGLRGFALGYALISRVIDHLRVELPRLTTFATLSPIPGFRPWLSALASSPDGPPGLAAIMAKLNESGWSADPGVSAELEAELVPLCARYLLYAKHEGEPADPVARFHLANGARLRRVNWLSDISRAGMRRSAGLTANYVYLPASLPKSLPPASFDPPRGTHRQSANRRKMWGLAQTMRRSP
jgi:malonyl-CoA decarboxylase